MSTLCLTTWRRWVQDLARLKGKCIKTFGRAIGLYWIATCLVQDQSACAIPYTDFAISKRTDDTAAHRTKKQDECSQSFTKHATIFWNTGAVHLAPAGAFSACSSMLAFIQCQELDAWTCSRVHTCKHDFLDWLLQAASAVCVCMWFMLLLGYAITKTSCLRQQIWIMVPLRFSGDCLDGEPCCTPDSGPACAGNYLCPNGSWYQ